MNRKTFLKCMALGGASFLGLPWQAKAAEDRAQGSLCQWARLKFKAEDGDEDDWNVHPHGDMNLVDHLADASSVNLQRTWQVASVHELDTMTPFPLLFMHAELAPEFDDRDRAHLREYFLRGGFLFAEDCVIGKFNHGNSNRNDFFFQRMLEELPKILPEARLERLPNDHPIFHSFYHFNDGSPHMQGTPHGGHGLTLDGRLVCYLSPSDLHCGWVNGDSWFGSGKSAEALKMGANVYIHAMTQGS